MNRKHPSYHEKTCLSCLNWAVQSCLAVDSIQVFFLPHKSCRQVPGFHQVYGSTWTFACSFGHCLKGVKHKASPGLACVCKCDSAAGALAYASVRSQQKTHCETMRSELKKDWCGSHPSHN